MCLDNTKTTFLKGRSAFSITSDAVQAGLAASVAGVEKNVIGYRRGAAAVAAKPEGGG
jgi:hypothetical protein